MKQYLMLHCTKQRFHRTVTRINNQYPIFNLRISTYIVYIYIHIKK